MWRCQREILRQKEVSLEVLRREEFGFVYEKMVNPDTKSETTRRVLCISDLYQEQ